jgi:hypothetical protein
MIEIVMSSRESTNVAAATLPRDTSIITSVSTQIIGLAATVLGLVAQCTGKGHAKVV